MAAKITKVGQAIETALADESIDDAEAATIIDAANESRNAVLNYDRTANYELTALDQLIRSPSRPFKITGRAAQRIGVCALTPPNQQCR